MWNHSKASLVIELKESKITEIARFVEMESADDTAGFIIPCSVEQHLAAMAKAQIIYLSIYERQTLVGFIILSLDDTASVEFRRIVVSEKGRGIGQHAMRCMEHYCVNELGRKRVWLDVFTENTRGIHIYQKQGYDQFDRSEYQGKPLLLMEKLL